MSFRPVMDFEIGIWLRPADYCGLCRPTPAVNHVAVINTWWTYLLCFQTFFLFFHAYKHLSAVFILFSNDACIACGAGSMKGRECVYLSHWSTAGVGLQLSEVQICSRCWCPVQWHRSMVCSSTCGQCHVHSWGMRLSRVVSEVTTLWRYTNLFISIIIIIIIIFKPTSTKPQAGKLG